MLMAELRRPQTGHMYPLMVPSKQEVRRLGFIEKLYFRSKTSLKNVEKGITYWKSKEAILCLLWIKKKK